MELISFMIVVWFVKTLAEDGWSTVKGTSNPRLDRRKARQKSRASNRVWGAFMDYLGDVADEAREEAKERRRKKRLANAQTIDAEAVLSDPTSPGPAGRTYPAGYNPDPSDPGVVDMATPPPIPPREETRRHDELTVQECTFDICPIHGKGRKTEPSKSVNPNPPSQENTEGAVMSEVQGLDQAIAYARSVAGVANQHSTTGAEQYVGHLTQRNVTGAALQSAYDMQAAFSTAAVMAEKHADELEKQKAVQEAYDSNPDAGDQTFQTAGR